LASLLGAGLALAGASIQGVFRNPLADPALIGISGGAALFAAGYLLISSQPDAAMLGLSGSAMLGGLLATGLVLLIGGRQSDIATLLLAGIAINAICLAGVGLLSFLAPEQRLRSVSFWALGSFNHVGWSDVLMALIIVPVMLRLLRLAAVLDVLTLGDAEAGHLGINAKRKRLEVIVWAALITGVSVSLVGIIAFVGLIVPHWVRMTIGAKHVLVLPFSMLGGALLLLAADWFSRWLLAPLELPVGIVTTLLGAPIFVILVARWSRGVWL
jgi:iron complex transport system permease protein